MKIHNFTIIVILLLSSFSLSNAAQQTPLSSTAPPQKEKANMAEINLLEERIKRIEEKSDLRLDSLAEKTEVQLEELGKRTGTQIAALKELMNTYVAVLGILFAIVTFFGSRTITNWIKKTIEDKTDREVENYVTKEYIERLLKGKGEGAINTLLEELETKSKKRLLEIDDLAQESKKILKELISEKMDFAKPLSPNKEEALKKFGEELPRQKSVEQYTFNDWFLKAMAEHAKGQYSEALKSWTNAIKKDPQSVVAYANRAFTYYMLKKYDEALADYTKEIELSPNNANAYSNRASMFSRMEQYNKAIEDCNKAIELDSQNINALNNRSHAYNNLRKFEKALADSSNAIELDSNYGFARINRSVAYFHLGKFNESMEDCNKVLEIDPNNATAFIMRGILYIKLGQADKAVENLNKAIELSPDDSTAYDTRGYLYLKFGQNAKAMEDLNKAIELAPENFNAYLNLSELNITIGNYEMALDNIEKSLPFISSAENKSSYLYYQCIIKHLLKVDSSKCDEELDEILKTEFITTWDSDVIENWLSEANIPEDARKYISEKTQLLMKHSTTFLYSNTRQ